MKSILNAILNIFLNIHYNLSQYICRLSHKINVSSNIKSIEEKRRTTKSLKQKWLEIWQIFKDSIDSLFYPSEIISIFKVKFGNKIKKVPKESLDELACKVNDIDFCYLTLNKVSRSFAFVIEQLPEELKDSVCIFYLVLRGLDSVEDDSNYPDQEKIILLKNFYKKLLIDHWSMSGVGDTEDYRILLNNFGKVINVFKKLDVKYQTIISDITQRMGDGMAQYVGKTDSIQTLESYNLYCHYVAGLVGYGLSALFAQSGLENKDLILQKHLSNSMGLFLQKTNIIRDYLEDLQGNRTWWPKQIWQNYASHLDEFSQNSHEQRSLECLNHMIVDALDHIPHVIDYLNRLKHPKIFQFCAIPQLMAIATLAQLYNNPLVFTSVVKIRKGLTCKLMLRSSNMKQIYKWFYYFIEQIEQKRTNSNNENHIHIHKLIHQIKNLCNQNI